MVKESLQQYLSGTTCQLRKMVDSFHLLLFSHHVSLRISNWHSSKSSRAAVMTAGQRRKSNYDERCKDGDLSLSRLLHYSLNNLTELEVEEMSVAPTAAASVSFSPLITW